MKKLALVLIALASMNSAIAAKVGAPAPDFNTTDINGNPVSLSQLKTEGKYVVLEWHNPECPYVKAQYETKRMQKIQSEMMAKGAVWVVVNSSAKGKEGYEDTAAAKKELARNYDAKTTPPTMVIDADGKIGQAYGAQTTPHMFVIDPKGNLIYNGALDDHPANNNREVASTKPSYVELALNESMSGKAVSKPTSKPYGCSVKY